MQGLRSSLCLAALTHACLVTFTASAAVAIYGAPDRVVPEPLRIGAILRTNETGAQQTINAWMLFVSTMNSRGGVSVQSDPPSLLQFAVFEADSLEPAVNISFWLSVTEVHWTPPGIMLTTGRHAGVTARLYENEDQEILTMLLRTVHQKVTSLTGLTVLVESGYQGCENISSIAAEWNLAVSLQALPHRILSPVDQPSTAMVICASTSSTLRFVQEAKAAKYMPQALLVTCPLSELSTLGADADFLVAFRRQLPANHSRFWEDYQQRFLQTPSDAAVLAYFAAQHLVEAIASGVTTTTSLQGREVPGEVVQQQAGSLVPILPESLFFPAPSWLDRACWGHGAPTGYGFSEGSCRRCNETEEVQTDAMGRRACVACGNESSCACEACQTACAPGSSLVAGRCVPCAPGRFSIGSSGCFMCPVGFISKAGASECEACALGSYAPQAGLSECLHCPLGHSANTTGRSVCTSCPAGSFSYMGLCQECAVGSFQARPGQSACVEDGLGQVSAESGTVVPSNAPGFYAIWAARDGVQPNHFEMERCVKEEACLSATCAEGSTGRQCFAVLGGFSAGASTRYRCFSWQLYVAVGIVMAVFYLAAYTRFATVLATSEVASHQLYLTMLKMFLNHCASMSVLLSCWLRAGSHTPLLEGLLGWAMLTDGAPPCGTEVFSMACLLQPWRTEARRSAFDRLAAASQQDFFSPALAEARETLASFHRTAEFRWLLFWALLPLATAFLPCFLLLIYLRVYMARHAQHWPQAAEFSSKVHLEGFDVACGHYAPDVLPQLLAISRRRLWGLSWPLMHCTAWVLAKPPIRSLLGSLCCCLLSPLLFIPRLFSKLDLLRFWRESAPLRICFLYFFSFPAARRSLVALTCQPLGSKADAAQVMYSNGVLDCDVTQPLLYFSFLAGFVWTMWPFLCWFQLRRDRDRSLDPTTWRRQYGIMLLGYDTSRWWWEALVSLQKLLFIAIEVVPISAVTKCFLIVCVSLGAMLCHVTLRPFDHRWAELLNRLEMKHLFVLLCSAFVCMMSLQSWLLPVHVVIVMATLQGLYVFTFLLSLGHLTLLATETSTLKSWEKGCLKRWMMFLLAYKRWQSDAEAYVAYDNVHRYVSVLANAGGHCTLPHLPIGRQVEAAGQRAHAQVRCKLSDVPQNVTGFRLVSSAQQKEVSRELLFTVSSITQHAAAMSSFSLDFVLRAAFLMAAEHGAQHSRHETEELPQEVDKHAWQEANRKRDLLVIASMAEEQRQLHRSQQALRAGPTIQQDLSREEDTIAAWGFLEEPEASEVHPGRQGKHRPEDGAVETEMLLRQKVYRMFSPTIFRRGCTFQDLKASLVLLRNTPPAELQQWLDFFERCWFLEFLDSDKEIHLMSGTRLEQGVQAVSLQILKAIRRPRRAMVLGEPGGDGDDVNIKVYLKWVRFVLYHYCGGIQAVDVGDVLRTRLSRPSRFVIQAQMAALDDEEEDDVPEEPEASVIIQVDEDALQRVEDGLDLAIAEGLCLEPTLLAMERLERGVDSLLDEISL